VPRSQNCFKCSQMKDSCGIKPEQHLENEAVEKSSVIGDVPQVKWMIKTSLLCLCFGALFVGCIRLETSPGHGSMVQATIKQATSLTTPTVSHTKEESRSPFCTIGPRTGDQSVSMAVSIPSIIHGTRHGSTRNGNYYCRARPPCVYNMST